MEWQGLPIEEILKQLPPGIAIAISLLLVLLGYRKAGGGAPPKDVEIAGAIVDNSAIFKLASSLDHHNSLVSQGHELMRQMIEAFNRNSDEIRELTRELRSSTTDFVRHR